MTIIGPVATLPIATDTAISTRRISLPVIGFAMCCPLCANCTTFTLCAAADEVGEHHAWLCCSCGLDPSAGDAARRLHCDSSELASLDIVRVIDCWNEAVAAMMLRESSAAHAVEMPAWQRDCFPAVNGYGRDVCHGGDGSCRT